MRRRDLHAWAVLNAAVCSVTLVPMAAPRADGLTAGQLQQLFAASQEHNSTVSLVNRPNGIAGLNDAGQLTASSVGDVGAATTSLMHGGPSRTLLARARDRTDILDYGAAIDGATDNSAAFYTAMAAAGAAQRPLYVPAGNYKFSKGGPPVSCHIPVYIDGGVNFTGNGPMSALNDTPNIAAQTIVLDTCADGTGMSNDLLLTMNSEATPIGSPSYQRNGLYINLRQVDSSLNDASHDAVGLFSAVNMASGLAYGRGWAANHRINIPATGWSYAKIIEDELHTDAPSSEPGTATNHPGHSIECSGSYPCTLATEIANAGQPWYYGLFSFDNATVYDLIQLRAYSSTPSLDFRVQHDGHVDAIGIGAMAPGQSISSGPQQRVAYLNGSDGGVVGNYVNTPVLQNMTSGIASATLVSGGLYNDAIIPKLPPPPTGGVQATLAVTGWSLASAIVGDSNSGAGLAAGEVFAITGGTCSIQPQLTWSGSSWKVTRAGACTDLPVPTKLTAPVSDEYGSIPLTYISGSSGAPSGTIGIAPLWQMTGVSVTTAGSGYPSGIPLDVWVGTPASRNANGVVTTVAPANITVSLGAATQTGVVAVQAKLVAVSGESHFASTTFSDADPGIVRDAKFGNNGIAILGGAKTDSLTVTGTAQIANARIQTVTLAAISGAYTVAGPDCGTTLRDNATSAHAITVPTGLPIGCRVSIVQVGAGAPTATPSSGMTIEAIAGAATPSAQYGAMTMLIDSATTALVVPGL